MLVNRQIELFSDITFTPVNNASDTVMNSSLQLTLQQQLPLLRLLNQQNKWQVWIAAKPMLKRSWLNKSGLNQNKIVSIANADPANMVNLIEKALLSKTSSYVVACIEKSLTYTEKRRLQHAVKISGTHLLLIDDHNFRYDDFSTLSIANHQIH